MWKLIDELRNRNLVDAKVLAILDQVRQLHRNPLVHKIFLEMDEAINLFDIAKGAMNAMAQHISSCS
jgi:hypothetical protein